MLTFARAYSLKCFKLFFLFFRHFIFVNLGLAILLHLPYSVWSVVFSPFIHQIGEYAKPMLQQSKTSNNFDEIQKFGKLEDNALPTMRFLFYHQIFCELLCAILLIVVSCAYLQYFNLDIGQDLILHPSVIAAKIQERLPSLGKCRIWITSTSGRQNSRSYFCTVNHHSFYEMSVLILGLYYVFGCLIVGIRILTLITKLVIPFFKR